jgi:hypothetical protein
LDVLLVRKVATEQQVVTGKERLARIVQMIVGLLRRFSEHADVSREDEPPYAVEQDYEQEQEQEHK